MGKGSTEHRKVGVVIGRFQPPHMGHLKLVEEAFTVGRVDEVVVVVGSINQPRTLKNPFTFEERRNMILKGVEEVIPWATVSVVGVPDNAGSDAEWVASIESEVYRATGSDDVILFGHEKDDSSYYLHLFYAWAFVPLKNSTGLNSTDIRKIWFSRHMLDYDLDSLAQSTKKELESLRTEPWYWDLMEEKAFIEDYQKQWSNSPYPPIFSTVDAVIIYRGQVLLIRRGDHPGKGTYALPGGFVGVNETLEAACIREVKEETGLTVSPGPSRVFDRPGRDQRGRIITHAFLIDLDDLDYLLFPRAGDDASEAMWVPFSWITENRHKMYADHVHIIQQMLKENHGSS